VEGIGSYRSGGIQIRRVSVWLRIFISRFVKGVWMKDQDSLVKVDGV